MKIEEGSTCLINEIIIFSTLFREAMDRCYNAGGFAKDVAFRKFPYGCCGDTSDMLGQYLLEKGIQTWYVCGTHYPTDGTDEENYYGIRSHAWITTADPRRTKKYNIIDITGDQFKNKDEYGFFNQKVFVGELSDFHKLFEVEVRGIRENKGLNALNGASPRLWKLYNMILEWILEYR